MTFKIVLFTPDNAHNLTVKFLLELISTVTACFIAVTANIFPRNKFSFRYHL